MADAHLLKHKNQLPGLCMGIVIERGFLKSKLQAIKLAMETLKFCTYSGKGGVIALKDFLSRFRIVMNTIIEAGGKTDDFTVTDAFEKEFKRIPEMKESVNRMESSKPESKRHTFKWQWETANNICDNLESSKVHQQLLKGCDPNAAEVNTIAVGASRNGRPAQALTGTVAGKARQI